MTTIETHISRVVLTERDAYKTKKPVRFGFVDYTTLAARKFFCEEEVRLNRRLAPSLYLGVDPVTGDSGQTIDYAVHMRRFPEGALFSEMLEAGRLGAELVDALADLLGAFHSSAPIAQPGQGFATPQRRASAALAALEVAARAMQGDEAAALRSWLAEEASRLQSVWEARASQGAVRESHGDLHLANIVVVDGEVMAFDGVEFDPALRWIDVIDDIAFAVMDFDAHGRPDFAFRLLNRWLDHTGEHAGVAALRFACAYRALVRAQVGVLRADTTLARRYVEAAMRWMQPATPRLVITHGLPGSGKTFRSGQLLESETAIRLRSDVERKRLFGLRMLERSAPGGPDLYTKEATERTYGVLFAQARTVLAAGWPVILDAAFLRRDERERARNVAVDCGVPFAILHCEADAEVLRTRLRARERDASEADENILRLLSAAEEPLSQEERLFVI